MSIVFATMRFASRISDGHSSDRMRWAAVVIVSCLVSSAFGHSLHAAPPTLEERYEALNSDVNAVVAASALTHAARAMSRAKEAAGRRDPLQSARARDIAQAALVLAERQISRAQSKQAVHTAQQRLLEARSKAVAEREALALARKQQATLREGSTQ